MRSKMRERAVEVLNICDLRIAKLGGALGNRFEHRLDIGGGAGNNAQDLARGHQLAIALLDLLERPGILNGDDGLICKGVEKLDLLDAERAYFVAADNESADR